ncbi:transcription factor of the MADS box [Orbilia blumenaviensis]|uniref:Transcription factor of the MADS box n=1 Tax=Orbilia blumenaviensis TaxID=1796055 RepID=A0AAV9VMM8_9PEZI
MSDNDGQGSPGAHEDLVGASNLGNGSLAQGTGSVPNESRGMKRMRPTQDEDDDDDDSKPGRERRKIEIKFIQDKSRRHITFSKRKAGIMKKAYELSVLTGTQVLLLVVSETGLVYTFTTPKLQPLVTRAEGKNLIQACLNAPEPNIPGMQENAEPDDAPESPEEHSHMQIPQQARALPPQVPVAGAYNMSPEEYQYLAQQQQQAHRSQYGMPPAHMQQPHPARTS